MTDVRLDAPVLVRVPASSANLGPGYDAIGLALGLTDEVEVTATSTGRVEVAATGESAEHVPTNEDHLIARALRHTLVEVGVTELPGLRLQCRNVVPHGRGLGSSAAAVVTGVVAARGLLTDPAALTTADVVHLASQIEGHPDNAAASVLGGLTVGWLEGARWHAVRLEPHPDVVPVVCVPDAELATARARAMLPDRVSHADAAFTAGRAALLVEALTRSPHLLLPATSERLHQDHREPAMPRTLALVRHLRRAGLAAVVSGAGPSVLVLATVETADDVPALVPAGWEVLRPGVDGHGAVCRPVVPATRGGDLGRGEATDAPGCYSDRAPRAR